MESGGEGIEYYFSRSVEELLPSRVECENCGKKDFKKVMIFWMFGLTAAFSILFL